MPIYEYTCTKCNDEFELLLMGSETAECPSCESSKVEKRFSVPAAHSSGSSQLPMAGPSPQPGCGLPQCGQGRCAGME